MSLTYSRDLAELQDVLGRADLLQSWKQSELIPGSNRDIVRFAAGIKIDGNGKGVRPVGCTYDAFAQISVEMEFSKPLGADHVVSLCAYQADLVVDGLDKNASDIRFALHLDYHSPEQQAHSLHPQFHWQLGGAKLDDVLDNMAGVLLFDSPRWPTYPLDPVLLVDFVLGHFNGRKRIDLLEDPSFRGYRELVSEALSRYAVPYFTALAGTSPLRGQYWPALMI